MVLDLTMLTARHRCCHRRRDSDFLVKYGTPLSWHGHRCGMMAFSLHLQLARCWVLQTLVHHVRPLGCRSPAVLASCAVGAWTSPCLLTNSWITAGTYHAAWRPRSHGFWISLTHLQRALRLTTSGSYRISATTRCRPSASSWSSDVGLLRSPT